MTGKRICPFLACLLLIAVVTSCEPRSARESETLSYKRPFLGRKELPPDLQWMKQVRLAAYANLAKEEHRRQFIKDIDVDIMDWYCTAEANRGDFMWKHGIRAAGPEEYEYQESLQFSNENAKAIFWDNGVTRAIDGSAATFPKWQYGGSYFMCHNAPKWHETVKQGLVRLVPFGDTITQDNIGCPLNKGRGNFCDWCNVQFKRYLRERFSEQEIRKLGIDNLDSFHAREYICALQKERGNEKTIEDPIVREYIRFQYISEANAWEDMMRVIRAESAQLGLPMRAGYGNQYGAWGQLPFATTLSSRADVVWIECGCYHPTWGAANQAWNALVYKVGAASGHFNRPVWTWPIGYADNQVFLRSKLKLELKKSPSGEPHVGFLRKFPIPLVLCEGLAEGGLAVMRPGDRLNTDVYQLHVQFARFVSANRALFAERKRWANVCLIYSFPTWMWRNFSSLGVTGKYRDYFPAIARVLEEAHIPYEVDIFGHPDVWDDADVLKSLSKYDAVILPSVDAMSDEQAKALRAYAANGGVIVSAGELATRDEDLIPRPKPALEDLVQGGKVAQISEEAMGEFLSADKREGGLQKIIEQIRSVVGDKLLVRTNAPASVWINTWSQADGRRIAVHLLNYDADVEKDCMIPAKNVAVTLRPPSGFDFDKVLWIHFPGEMSELKYKREKDQVSFEVPELNLYGIAVLTKGRELEISSRLDAVRRLRERLTVANQGNGGCPAEIMSLIGQAETAMARGDAPSAEPSVRQAIEKGEQALSKAIERNCASEKHAREATIASAKNAVAAFDFGNGDCAEGWKRVTPEMKFSAETGCGWDDATGLHAHTGNEPDRLHGDFIDSRQEKTFRARVPNGRYVVTVVSGHPWSQSRYAATAVTAEGKLKLLGARSNSGIFFNRSFSVEVNDGVLDVTFPAPRSMPLAAQCDFHNAFFWTVCGLLVQRADANPPDLAFHEALCAGGLKNWAVAGPFDDGGCEGMDIHYPPESKVDFGAAYPGVGGREIRWQTYSQAQDAGIATVPLRDFFAEDEGVVAFAYTKLYSPKDVSALLLFGSTGIAEVRLNGDPAIRDYTAAGLMADEIVKPIKLNSGWNDVLVKVSSKYGGPWAFSASVLDAERRPISGIKTSPTADAVEPRLARATRLLHPLVKPRGDEIVFNETGDIAVCVENVSPEPMAGTIELAAHDDMRDCVRIEPAAPQPFTDLKPNASMERSFKVTLLKLPKESGHVKLFARLNTPAMSKTSEARLRIQAPLVRLTVYDPAEEPKELVVDAMDDVSQWRRNGAESVEKLAADAQDKKEGQASLLATRINDGDGEEDFARIAREFPDGTDWTAFNTFSYWAKVTDDDPNVKSRDICFVLNNRDRAPYQTFGRQTVPVNQWTPLECDITANRREDVKFLVPHLYEMNLKAKGSYTWRIDDLRLNKASKAHPELSRADEKPPVPDQMAARLCVSNPGPKPVEGKLSVVLPPGWSCDLPANTVLSVPAREARVTPMRIALPPNTPGLEFPVKVEIKFANGALLESDLKVQAPKKLTLGRTDKPPAIDGSVGDECWKKSKPIENFVFNDGSGPSTAQTRAWVCRDAQNLYIAYECLEPLMGSIKADVKDRDGRVWEDDCIEVFVSPNPQNPKSMFHFIVNSLGTLRDEFQGGGEWNGKVKACTSKGKDRWTVEIAIPLADLGGAPRPSTTWLINLNRTRPAKGGTATEYSCWSCTYGAFAQPERFARISFAD